MLYCVKCGSPLNEEANFCQKCGHPLYPMPAPLGAPPSYVPPPYAAYTPYPYDPQTHPYKKIGGFLMFLLVSTVIGFAMTPLAILLFVFLTRMMGELDPELAAMFTGQIISMTFTMAISLVGSIPAIQLLRRKTNFLTLYHIITIGGWAVLPVQLLFLWHQSAAVLSPWGFVSSAAYGLVIGIITFILYRMYYTKSVRVRTYMGTDAYITQCPFTRGVAPPVPAVPDIQQDL